MASAFATQLRTLAASSTNELDVRARRSAHAESLLFPAAVAAKQDFETIFALCSESFVELCALDARFREFERSLFSAQAREQDREVDMTRKENEALDLVVERCLTLLGPRLLLRPVLKCVEWLVRRFRVHVYNTAALLLAFLPYHEMAVWKEVMRIVPREKVVGGDWKWLVPYVHKGRTDGDAEGMNVPRHAVVYAATNNDGFFAAFNQHVLAVARQKVTHPALLRVWGSVVVEALFGKLSQARSGRKEVERQRVEDVLLRVLPVLSDGLEIPGYPDLTMSCYTLAVVVASKADVDDRVLDSIIDAVVPTLKFPDADLNEALVCLNALVSQKQSPLATQSLVAAAMEIPDLAVMVNDLNGQYPVEKLIGALIGSLLADSRRKNHADRVQFLERLICIPVMAQEDELLTNWILAIIAKIQSLDNTDSTGATIRGQLVDLLQRLNDSRDFSQAITTAGQRIDSGAAGLEAILGSTVALIEQAPATNADEMEVDGPSLPEDTIQAALDALPLPGPDVHSLLVPASLDQRLIDQLTEAFRICSKSQEGLQKWKSLPYWQDDPGPSTFYLIFLLCLACGPSETLPRAAALRLSLQSLADQTDMDFHALIPYALTCLSDPSQAVRRAAADLLVEIKRQITEHTVLGQADHHGSADARQQTEMMEKMSGVQADQAAKIIEQAFLPALEECVLDASHVVRVVHEALTDTTAGRVSANVEVVGLKKALRHVLFDLITIYGIAMMPLLRVKISMVRLLEGVQKVGASSTSKALAPLLQQWASLDEAAAQEAVKAERLSLAEVDAAVARLVSRTDKDAVNNILTMLAEETPSRHNLVAAFFDRLNEVWDDVREGHQMRAAIQMFDMMFSANSALSSGARGVLQSVSLSTEALRRLLQHSTSGLAQMQTDGPPKKRRRTSHSRDSLPPDFAQEFNSGLARLTFALELVDNAKSEADSQLLSGLFEALATLKRMKQQQNIESPYLLNLCLGSILSIVDKARASAKRNLDLSGVRTELVTDCVRTSENPQVQNTAVLLSASLAALSPERMLHNIMPIFTFMGHSILSKDDEHSIHVINSAIDRIIPPLVSSLKKQDESDLVRSTSGMLSSFTAAFDHISQDRRVGFFQRLLDRMGADDFSYVVIAMLANRRRDDAIQAFFGSLMADAPLTTQLITYQSLISLTSDVFSTQPRTAGAILGLNKANSPQDRHTIAVILLQTAMQLLKSKSLRIGASRLDKLPPDSANLVRHLFRNSLQQILETIRDLKQQGEDLVAAAKLCLDALLELPTLVELFQVLPTTLKQMDEQGESLLRQQALRVLTSQLQDKVSKDSRTQAAAMVFLSELTRLLTSESEIGLKRAAVACIDRLVELYGRKDIEATLAAANIISGDECLGSQDGRLQIMSLLCLASMLEVLKEGVIPIVSNIITKMCSILEMSMQEESQTIESHDAAYSLLAALVSHVPFMISDEYLQQILRLSAESAYTEFPSSSINARQEALKLLAKKIELKSLVEVLGKTHRDVVENGFEAVIESLTVISDAIDHSPKSIVIRSVDGISQLLLHYLDFRRIQFTSRDEDSYTDAEVDKIENKSHEVSVKFIYKLNDTTFRPVFESWVEWAVKCYDVSDGAGREKARIFRQTSLFNFLAHFFDTLKSIVTSYASYIIEPAVVVLQRFADAAIVTDNKPQTASAPITPDEITLYTSALSGLHAAFTHDADAFFSAPAHFSPLSSLLISQLTTPTISSYRKTSTSLLSTHIFPCIVSFATSVLDTPAHHVSLNHAICQLRHHSLGVVRLASIQLQHALTDDDTVGDEWVANVVGVGAGSDAFIYVNEMLEDDDEQVEREVRRWVQSVRTKVGEDVFEL